MAEMRNSNPYRGRHYWEPEECLWHRKPTDSELSEVARTDAHQQRVTVKLGRIFPKFAD